MSLWIDCSGQQVVKEEGAKPSGSRMMNIHVLVLNRSYMPLGKVSWQEAFGMVFSGRAEVVEEYADRVVRSAKQTFNVPSIIRFLSKASTIFKRKGVKFNRRNMYIRDSGSCQYCGVNVSLAEFTFDHVIPRSQGGGTSWGNIVVCCQPCNHHKADRTPEQAKMRLRSKPVKPKSLPGDGPRHMAWDTHMPESWKDYLGSVRYWTVGLT